LLRTTCKPFNAGQNKPQATPIPFPLFDDDNPSLHNREHLEYIIGRTTGRTIQGIGFDFMVDLLAASLSIGAAATATAISKQVEHYQTPSASVTGQQPSSKAQMLGFSLATLIYPHLNQVIQGLARTVPLSKDELGKCETVVNDVIKESASLLRLLSLRIRYSVDELDKAIANSIVALKQQNYPTHPPHSVKEIYEWLYLRQCYWLGQPRVFQNYLKTLDRNKRDQIIKRQPQTGKKKVADIFRALLASSFRGPFGPARLQYLFAGLPGTGKTTLLREIADAISAKLILLNNETLLPQDIDGVPFETKEPIIIPGETRLLTVKGAIRDRLTSSGVKNPLVAIDEFSTRDQNFRVWKLPKLLKFLDREGLEPAAAGEADLSGIAFFLLTNDDLEIIEGSIISRVDVFSFDSLDNEALENARDAQIADILGQYREENAKKIAQNDQEQADIDLVHRIIGSTEEALEKYRDLFIIKNKDPGGRTIKLAVLQTIDLIFLEKYLSRDDQYEVPEGDIVDIITRYSESYKRNPSDDDSQTSEEDDVHNEGEASGSAPDRQTAQPIRSMLEV
jgi:hypothetical protein